jgi:aminoglycoside 3-N-acetyltransferase
MNSWAWSENDLHLALTDLNLLPGDHVFLHSNLGFSGVCKQANPSATILEGILDKIGESGSIFLPAFSYSFPQGRTFDPLVSSPSSAMGSVSIVADSLGFEKSRDPIFGVLGKGERVGKLFESQLNRSFGPGSLFSKLLDLDVKMLSINAGAGGTIVHEMEYRISVPYRYEKIFQGKVLDSRKNISVDTEWISYVRDLSNPLTEAKFENLTKNLHHKGIWKKAILGKGYISKASSMEVFNYVSEAIQIDPALLLK